MKIIKLKNATLELSAEDIAELRKQLEEEDIEAAMSEDKIILRFIESEEKKINKTS